MPTWDFRCCAHGTQSSPQTRMWKKWRTLLFRNVIRIIAERDISPRSGDKLSLDAEFMSSKSYWTNTVLRPSAVLAKFSLRSKFTVSSPICCTDVTLGSGATHAHSAHHPSVVALQIHTLSMFFSAASPRHDLLHHSDPSFKRRERRHQRVHISPQCANTELSLGAVQRHLETRRGRTISHKEPFRMLSFFCSPVCSTEKPSGKLQEILKKIGCDVQ